MNNKIIFSTYCHDEFQHRYGMHKLINSFSYFNPNYQIVFYGSNDINRIYSEYNVNLSNALPCIMLDIKRRYNSEFICHIDADSLCLDSLDEIINCDYDIASVRNNSDFHTGDERVNRPQPLWNLPNHKYVNCGCLSTSSEKFLLEWIELNRQITLRYGDIRRFWHTDVNWFWMSDQNWMNVLFHYGGYKSKILDPMGGDVFYGASANMFSGCSGNYIQSDNDPKNIIDEWKINGWQSWRDIEFINNKFYLYGKMVKLLHMAGGGNPNTAIKLNFNMFSDSIRRELTEITKYNE